jgi:hypothetical protein
MVPIQYNSIGLINTQYRCDLQELTKVTSYYVTPCCNPLAPVCQLSSGSRSARMCFSQVQQVFIVEHYLASRSYLTCQNEFSNTFPDSPVPTKSAISRMVNRFRLLQELYTGFASSMRKIVNACIAERGGHFQHLI